MDSKIILAILIVALIGVVAATYNNEATDAIQTLTSVATEEDSQDSATDILESDVGSTPQDSLTIDEDVVKPDNSAAKKSTNKKDNKAPSTSTQQSSSNTQQTSSNSNTGTSSNSNTGTSNQPTTTNNTVNPSTNTNNSNNQQSNTTTTKISSSRAKEIATNNLPGDFKNAVASTPKLYDNFYEVTFYSNGKAVGYYEIDANTGAITGGAFENEVPDVSN